MNWHEYFTYDPETGNLVWKERPSHMSKNLRAHAAWNANYAGKVAGHAQGAGAGSAIYVRVHSKMHRAHRIIWEMHHGPIPEKMRVDHIDGDFLNNRVSNLRLATQAQNGFNRRHSVVSKTKLKGVSFCASRGKYDARIKANGVLVLLGRYATKAEAAVVYAKASIRYHGAFSPFVRKLQAAP